MKREHDDHFFTCEQREKIAWVTINHLLTADAVERLSELYGKLRDGSEARVIILRLGVQETSSALTPDQIIEIGPTGQDLAARIEDLGKPVIAAIDGQVFDIQFELALACTWRMATARSEFAPVKNVFVRLPGFVRLTRLPRIIGKSRALDLILNAEPVAAQEALRIGLIDRLAGDRAELDDICAELAGRVSKHAPLAIKYALDAVNHGMDLPLAEGLRFESALFSLCFATDDVKEGTQAFLEKREPMFKGT